MVYQVRIEYLKSIEYCELNNIVISTLLKRVWMSELLLANRALSAPSAHAVLIAGRACHDARLSTTTEHPVTLSSTVVWLTGNICSLTFNWWYVYFWNCYCRSSPCWGKCWFCPSRCRSCGVASSGPLYGRSLRMLYDSLIPGRRCNDTVPFVLISTIG